MAPSDDKKVSNTARRNLLKALAAGGTVAAVTALPERWVRPIVESVELPVHAQSSCLTYGASGLTAAGFGQDELAQVCVTVCGSSATATFQTVFGGTDVFIRRTGAFNNGAGTMAATTVAPGCNAPPSRAATLTNITPQSLTFTMQRGSDAPGPFVAVLPVVGSCPNFVPLLQSCVSAAGRVIE